MVSSSWANPGVVRRAMVLARLQMVFVALLFSTGGAAIKATTLDAWSVAVGRSAVAALLIFCAVPVARRSWTVGILGCGVAYATTLVLFVHANRLATASAAVFLQATAPLYVVLAAPRVLGERLRRHDSVLIVGLASALVLLLVSDGQPQASASAPAAGAMLATLSAISYAVVQLGLRFHERSEVTGAEAPDSAGGARVVLCGNLLTVVACAPFASSWWSVLSTSSTSSTSSTLATLDLAVILYLGLFQVGLAYLLMLRVARSLRAVEISLLLLIEPLASPLWAWLLHRESVAMTVWLGGAVAIATMLVHAALGARRAR